MYVRYGADGVPRIDIRGLRTRNVMLLQDGVPLNSSYDGQFDPASIPVDNIAEIKVTRGGSSVLYGAGGNAGVIEIITRATGDSMSTGVAAEYEFSEAYEVRGSISGRAGGVGLSLWGSVFDRAHFELSDDVRPTALQPGDERGNSDRQQSAMQGNSVFDAGDAHVGFSLSYLDGKYGKPPTTVNSTESVYANRPRVERAEFDALSLQAAVEFGRDEPWMVRPTVYFNRDGELTNGYDDADYDSQVRSGAFQEDATLEVFGGGALASLRLGNGALLSASERPLRLEVDRIHVERLVLVDGPPDGRRAATTTAASTSTATSRGGDGG